MPRPEAHTSGPQAFWSYAHGDNDVDRGAIVALARSVSREDALITGYPVERADDLFVDCQSIRWGEDWRARIDKALAEAIVLVPVLSPGYFKRPECRRELESFLARDAALVCPILYVPIQDFTAENEDELVARASQLQYEDCTDLRFADPEDSEYRRAVNRLARRLRDVVAVPGRPDELRTIRELWPGLREANMNLRIVAAQYKATRAVLKEEGWVPHSPQEGSLPRFYEATQLTPLEERCMAWAGVQLARTEELDPLIATVIAWAEDRADLQTLRDLDADVRRLKLSEPIGITPQDEAQANLRLKHVMRDLADVAPRTEQAMRAANERMLRWRRGLESIAASSEQRGSA